MAFIIGYPSYLSYQVLSVLLFSQAGERSACIVFWICRLIYLLSRSFCSLFSSSMMLFERAGFLTLETKDAYVSGLRSCKKPQPSDIKSSCLNRECRHITSSFVALARFMTLPKASQIKDCSQKCDFPSTPVRLAVATTTLLAMACAAHHRFPRRHASRPRPGHSL